MLGSCLFADWVSGFREDGLGKGEQTWHHQGNRQIEVYICIIFFNLCSLQLHICLTFIFSNKKAYLTILPALCLDAILLGFIGTNWLVLKILHEISSEQIMGEREKYYSLLGNIPNSCRRSLLVRKYTEELGSRPMPRTRGTALLASISSSVIEVIMLPVAEEQVH